MIFPIGALLKMDLMEAMGVAPSPMGVQFTLMGQSLESNLKLETMSTQLGLGKRSVHLVDYNNIKESNSIFKIYFHLMEISVCATIEILQY
jgi:hypothetical protein